MKENHMSDEMSEKDRGFDDAKARRPRRPASNWRSASELVECETMGLREDDQDDGVYA
jgi:hypothetical protein